MKATQSCSTLSFIGQNTGVGSLPLLQAIFPTQGTNPGLPHCRRILYQLSHKGSPRILEWVTYPFSSKCSWPRNQTRISSITGGFFTNWAIREALKSKHQSKVHKSHHFMANRMEEKRKWWQELFFLGSKITSDGDCSHKIKRHFLFGKKAMSN